MAHKSGIQWKRKDADGKSCEVAAKLVGDTWRFSIRGGRYDDWQPMPAPPLEDWEELLDAVERRVGRGFIKAVEVTALRSRIRKLFPGSKP